MEKCNSITCPFKKNDKCTNEVVIRGEYCMNKSNGEVVEIKLTKGQLINKFIDDNRSMNKDELYKSMEKRFGLTRNNARKYYSNWNKDTEKEKNKAGDNELINRLRIIETIEMQKIAGECNTYIACNGKVKVDNIEIETLQDIEGYTSKLKLEDSKKISEFKEQLDINTKRRVEELLEVLKMTQHRSAYGK